MWKHIRKLLEMIRFSHTLFALPFALMAAVMAWETPLPEEWGDLTPVRFRWLDLIGVLVCMVGARSAAMAFNRWADRLIDARNPRTRQRHLPSGQLTVATVVWFTVATALLFIGGTCLFLPNWLPLAISIPVLGVVFGYSYAKRFTPLAHFWLGIALMLAPVCTWLAIRGLVVIQQPGDLSPAIFLGLAVFFWVAGFDIIYACQDVEFDRAAGLRSVPVWLGVRGALNCAAICHGLMLGMLVLLPLAPAWFGSEFQLGWIYWTAVVVVLVLLIYEHSLVRPDDLSRMNVAFFHVNAVVSLGLLAAIMADVYCGRQS